MSKSVFLSDDKRITGKLSFKDPNIYKLDNEKESLLYKLEIFKILYTLASLIIFITSTLYTFTDVFPKDLKTLKNSKDKYKIFLYILTAISGIVFLCSLIYFIKLSFGFYFSIFNLILVFLLVGAIIYYWFLFNDTKDTINYPGIIFTSVSVILIIAAIFIVIYEIELEKIDIQTKTGGKFGFENVEILKDYRKLVGDKIFEQDRKNGYDYLLNKAELLLTYKEIVGDKIFEQDRKSRGLEAVSGKAFGKILTIKVLVNSYIKNDRNKCKVFIENLGGGREGEVTKEIIENMKSLLKIYNCDEDSESKLGTILAKKYRGDIEAAKVAIRNLNRNLEIGLKSKNIMNKEFSMP